MYFYPVGGEKSKLAELKKLLTYICCNLSEQTSLFKDILPKMGFAKCKKFKLSSPISLSVCHLGESATLPL